MTDAATKKANSANIMSGARQARSDTDKRTTHPSYTEYSWSSLTGRNQSIDNSRGQAPQSQARGSAQSRTNPNIHTAKGANTQRAAYSTANAGYMSARAGYTSARAGYSTANSMNTANARYAAASTSAGYAPQKTRRAAPTVNTQRINASEANLRRMTSAGARQVSGARPMGQNPTAQKQKARAAAKPVGIEKVKQKAAKIRKKSITTLHTIVIQKSYAFPLSIVLIAVAVTALILAVITASVRINEITTENSELSNKYASLLNEENDLRTELETRDDLRVVEQMAQDELGMVKKDQVQKYYLTINKQDKIELVDEEVAEKKGFIDELLEFGASIADRIRAFFGL